MVSQTLSIFERLFRESAVVKRQTRREWQLISGRQLDIICSVCSGVRLSEQPNVETREREAEWQLNYCRQLAMVCSGVRLSEHSEQTEHSEHPNTPNIRTL